MATVDEILTKQAYAAGDETWTKDNNYPSYTMYAEPEHVPVTNKRIADFNDQVSVRGEQNAQFVGFQLPRYDDAMDLTKQNLYIHYQTAYGGSDGVPCNVSWSDNYVRMCWMIPGQATQQPEAIQMMIYATGTNSVGDRTVWKTLPATYTIHDGLEIGGGIPEPDQSWYEQFVQQMEGKVSTAQGYANDAQASKTAAAGSATAAAQSADASAQALAEFEQLEERITQKIEILDTNESERQTAEEQREANEERRINNEAEWKRQAEAAIDAANATLEIATEKAATATRAADTATTKASEASSSAASAGQSATTATQKAEVATTKAAEAAASAERAQQAAGCDGTAQSISAIDTQGLLTEIGGNSNAQALLDELALRVATIGNINTLQNEITDIMSYIGYTDADIYGVEVDFKNKKFTRLAGAENLTSGADFDKLTPWGGRKRCNVTDAGKIIAYYGDAGFSETGVLTSAITVGEGDAAVTYAVGTKVQVMVEQPKFYYKVVPLELEKIEGGKGFHMRKARYYVSDTMKAGFKLHPAFIKDGKEKNVIYLSAYEGCAYDKDKTAYNTNDAQDVDWTNDILASIANAKPTSGLQQTGATRNGFRKIAANRGAGWSQQTIQSVSATQILFLVEYASFNIQSNVGVGVTNKTDDGTTSMTEVTGATTILGNKTGAVTNTNGWNVVSYRGEENPFGNIWKWVDGINVNNGTTFAEGDVGTIYVADHDFADNTGEDPYTEIGFSSVYLGWSYISAFGYSEDGDWLFFPTEGKGNSSLPVGDCGQVFNPGWRVAHFGANWFYSSPVGLFSLSVYCYSAYRYRVVGGRLLYVPDGTDAPAA